MINSSNVFYNSKHLIHLFILEALQPCYNSMIILEIYKLRSCFEFWPSPDNGSSSKNPLKVFLLGVGEGQ